MDGADWNRSRLSRDKQFVSSSVVVCWVTELGSTCVKQVSPIKPLWARLRRHFPSARLGRWSVWCQTGRSCTATTLPLKTWRQRHSQDPDFNGACASLSQTHCLPLRGHAFPRCIVDMGRSNQSKPSFGRSNRWSHATPNKHSVHVQTHRGPELKESQQTQVLERQRQTARRAPSCKESVGNIRCHTTKPGRLLRLFKVSWNNLETNLFWLELF